MSDAPLARRLGRAYGKVTHSVTDDRGATSDDARTDGRGESRSSGLLSALPGSKWLSLSTFGKLLIAGGAALIVAGLLVPGVVAWLLPSIARPDVPEGGLLALGISCLVFAGIAVALRVRGRGLPALTTRPPERGTSSSIAMSGRAFTRQFRIAKSAQYQRLQYDSPNVAEFEARLESAAIETYRRETGVTAAAAERAIDEGVWTDDQVAAAMLGGDVRVPARHWLRRRIDPAGAYELAVERTTAAIERLENND